MQFTQLYVLLFIYINWTILYLKTENLKFFPLPTNLAKNAYRSHRNSPDYTKNPAVPIFMTQGYNGFEIGTRKRKSQPNTLQQVFAPIPKLRHQI